MIKNKHRVRYINAFIAVSIAAIRTFQIDGINLRVLNIHFGGKSRNGYGKNHNKCDNRSKNLFHIIHIPPFFGKRKSLFCRISSLGGNPPNTFQYMLPLPAALVNSVSAFDKIIPHLRKTLSQINIHPLRGWIFILVCFRTLVKAFCKNVCLWAIDGFNRFICSADCLKQLSKLFFF